MRQNDKMHADAMTDEQLKMFESSNLFDLFKFGHWVNF